MVRKKVFFASIALLVLILDQLSKYLILTFKLKLDLKLFLIHFVKNTGAGFGILQNQTFILGLISLGIALSVVFFYNKIPKDNKAQVLFAVFLGGVLGNLIDRLFRSYVVDFIDLRFWPVFNLADMCITLSVVGLVIYYWKE